MTYSKLRLSKFKVRLQVSFWGAPTHVDVIEFSNVVLRLKNQRSGRKLVYGFSIIMILKGINDVLKSKSPCIFEESMLFVEQKKYRLRSHFADRFCSEIFLLRNDQSTQPVECSRINCPHVIRTKQL